ncbi:MAG: spermidine synthase [Phenylobacterium sp.]|uniref:spermidine synthase n=1 Tax=Phenylobacterium sp. TaxID=1871053 RepID=UPI00391CA6D5
MTTSDVSERTAPGGASALFAVTIFASAALVFLVQPMVAKMVLPLLGGSPSVWNTSMVFFQACLLIGYGYAHLLQRIPALRTQAIVHGVVLLGAAAVLPLRVTDLLGEPASAHPALWLLGVLAVSVGAPFAALSATAPLVQAWHARTSGRIQGKEPYSLYAASNLGSFLALLAYPAVVEPTQALGAQTLGWTFGYAGFVLLIAALGTFVARARAGDSAPSPVVIAAPVSWRDRGLWVVLAAIPSSLMLGVTTHITMDVVSAPLFWVAPLALYLLTFVLAFQDKPLISRDAVLMFQAAALAGCLLVLPFAGTDIVLVLFLHLSAFFLTALMCHQALVARRPEPSRLTEFYLWMSVGGVLGGAFNALLAPLVFDNVWEYPLVLVLSCLARPWGKGGMEPWRWSSIAVGVFAGVAAPIWTTFHGVGTTTRLLLAAVSVMAFIVRGRALSFLCVIAVLAVVTATVGDRVDARHSWRSFFGVVRQSEMPSPAMGGQVRMLSHGTTLHGAQALDPRYRCRPLTYYAPETPIGQVFSAVRAERAVMNAAAVGLGTGAVSAYVRAGDRLTFFEIDPLVVRISSDPAHFSYTTACAQGEVRYVVGDARLTLAKQPPESFDVLLIDAFSSDSVPAHLLTAEAVAGYLSHLKPDGLLILHLSNRHMELLSPAIAAAEAAGGAALVQRHTIPPGTPALWQSSEDVVLVGRSSEALAPFEHDARWDAADAGGVKPWTDDYVNIVGAIYRRQKERWTWLP